MARAKKLLVNPSRSFVAKDRTYLTPHMRQELEKKLKSLEFTTKNIGNAYDPKNPWLYNPDRLDIGDMRRSIAKTKRTIANHTPPSLTAKDKDALYRRAKYLETLIKKDMPTRDEMHGKRRLNTDSGKYYQETNNYAVKKNMDWTLKQQGNVREWKQIMRAIDPHDPDVTNVERLRRGRSTAS